MHRSFPGSIILLLSATSILNLAACSGGGGTDDDTDGTLGTGASNASGGSVLGGVGGAPNGVGGNVSTGGALGSGGFSASSGGTNAGGAPMVGSGGAGAGGTTIGTGGASPSGGATGSGGSASSSTRCENGPEPGFFVEDGKLFDVNCNQFIMRGANVSHAWFADQTQNSLRDLASVGGNAVRIVMATGARWTRTSGQEVSNLISWAKQNKLVAMLEVHDSTGYPEQSGSVSPDDALNYWKSSDIRAAIDGQEAYVLINIANESFGNNQAAQWQGYYESAVPNLRNAGIKHTLVVDAPNWGQDYENRMRDGGATPIFNADPNKNVIFSVHMYDVYGNAQIVTQYFNAFQTMGLPLVIGEFASDHGNSGNIDEATIMDQADQKGVGYLGWSWSGNGSDLASLDITNNFSINNLTQWGSTLINGANGIKETGMTCSCFN